MLKASFQHRVHSQFAARCKYVRLQISIFADRAHGPYDDVGDAAEPGDQRVRHPHFQSSVPVIACQRVEWKHTNAWGGLSTACDYRRLALVHGCNKPVTSSWNRNNVTVLGSFFAEHAAQRGDALIQVVFFNNSVGPDCPDKGFFGENFVGMLDQINQRVESLRPQG